HRNGAAVAGAAVQGEGDREQQHPQQALRGEHGMDGGAEAGKRALGGPAGAGPQRRIGEGGGQGGHGEDAQGGAQPLHGRSAGVGQAGEENTEQSETGDEGGQNGSGRGGTGTGPGG